ncbi:enoyl-CoA hydratase domain-containing protein 3, mitochondrial isoform X1 [Daphnia magna]|uniref:enoyl-CoA hydratase domain-containing protein 3, mitochondrial isoform X1 n=2 Tax=Daphnia magna TaxID=35525 RepID=UPI001E1BA8FA|nr:enoyl-CoA hydratase domain-containing protein 3, mitochondrial isoform X1 [Daphnia magna]
MTMAVYRNCSQIKCLRSYKKSFSSSAATQLEHFKLIKFANQNGVYNVQLDSPSTRNALSLEMLNELHTTFKMVNEAKDSRCVLLSSTGKVFSAGHNLKELTKDIPETHHGLVFSTCTSLMKLLLDCPVPIVAKVDGIAAAAGCQLVAMCDIVVASSTSMFSTPGVNLGLFCSTPGVAIARSIPMKLASYMLYTGLPISAEEALKAGLVSRVVKADQLETETQKVIESIRQKSLPVIRLGKQFLQRQIKMDNIMEAYKEGESVMMNNLQLHDTQEGLQSFSEKRKPQFQDK